MVENLSDLKKILVSNDKYERKSELDKQLYIVRKRIEKEIRKQKFQKILGFSGSILLPILTLLALL